MATKYLKGGDELQKQLTLLSAKAKNAGLLSVGFPKGSTERDGTPTPLVAFINEFGRTVHSKEGDYYQLPRPFFRRMIAKDSSGWGEALGKLLVAKHYDAVKALEPMGKFIEGQLVKSIQDLVSPPLAESTIRAKGFDKPLIHHGDMWKRVNSWVDSK